MSQFLSQKCLSFGEKIEISKNSDVKCQLTFCAVHAQMRAERNPQFGTSDELANRQIVGPSLVELTVGRLCSAQLVSFAARGAALAADSDSFCAAQSAVLRRRQFRTRAALAIRLLTRPAAFRLTFAHRRPSHIVASITVEVTAHAHDGLFLCTVFLSICGRQQLGAQDFDSTNILHGVQKIFRGP